MNQPSSSDRTTIKQSEKPADNVPLAIGVIIITVLALSLGDALIKLTSSNFVLWQIFILRSVITIPSLLVFMRLSERTSLTIPNALGWVTVRCFLLTAMWICYYVSLPRLTLSVAASVYYTLPIFITLFAAFFNGESISRLGWIAVIVGFVGVFLILKPSIGDFNWYALLPLLAAILFALAMVLTRTKCRQEHPLMLSLSLNISFVIVGGIAAAYIATMPDESRNGFLLAQWSSMGVSEWFSMFLLAVSILVGSIGAAIAYQNGPSSIVGVFDFGYVGFAVVWGVLFFNEIPDAVAIIGLLLIVLAGIVTLRR